MIQFGIIASAVTQTSQNNENGGGGSPIDTWYFRTGSNSFWSNPNNWFSEDNGVGVNPASPPWTDPADTTTLRASTDNGTPPTLDIALDSAGALGTCYIPGITIGGGGVIYNGVFHDDSGAPITNNGTIQGGDFTVNTFYNSGNVNGGAYTTTDFVNSGTVTGGTYYQSGTFTNSSSISGGLFYSNNFTNNGSISGGEWAGNNFDAGTGSITGGVNWPQPDTGGGGGSFDPAGTFISSGCDQGNFVTTYADGNGGSYDDIVYASDTCPPVNFNYDIPVLGSTNAIVRIASPYYGNGSVGPITWNVQYTLTNQSTSDQNTGSIGVNLQTATTDLEFTSLDAGTTYTIHLEYMNNAGTSYGFGPGAVMDYSFSTSP